MNDVFKFVYKILIGLSQLTGFSYKAINVIVYYMLIPLIYFYFIDKLIKKNWFKIGFLFSMLGLLLLVDNFEKFAVNVFDESVVFLNWFSIIGWNYVEASVIICVFLPLFFLGLLLYLLKRRN